MYIELFILDNFLMDWLIVRAAYAFSARPLNLNKTFLAATVGTFYALLALAFPFMGRTLPKLLMVFIFSLFIPFYSIKDYLFSALAVFSAAVMIGGATTAIALGLGGGFANGYLLVGAMPLRIILISVFFAIMMPLAFRSIRRHAFAPRCRLKIIVCDEEFLFSGFVDTGSSLACPFSGTPAIAVFLPQLLPYAKIPIPASTLAGTVMFMGLVPNAVYINDIPVEAVIALSEKRIDGAEAIVPSVLF